MGNRRVAGTLEGSAGTEGAAADTHGHYWGFTAAHRRILGADRDEVPEDPRSYHRAVEPFVAKTGRVQRPRGGQYAWLDGSGVGRPTGVERAGASGTSL